MLTVLTTAHGWFQPLLKVGTEAGIELLWQACHRFVIADANLQCKQRDSEGDWAAVWAAQGGCGLSIHADTQKPCGRSPGKLGQGGSAWAGGMDQTTLGGPFDINHSVILWTGAVERAQKSLFTSVATLLCSVPVPEVDLLLAGKSWLKWPILTCWQMGLGKYEWMLLQRNRGVLFCFYTSSFSLQWGVSSQQGRLCGCQKRANN